MMKMTICLISTLFLSLSISFAFVKKSQPLSWTTSSLSINSLLISNKRRNINIKENNRLLVLNMNANDNNNNNVMNNNEIDIIAAAELMEEEEKKKNLPRSYLVLGIILLTFVANQWSRLSIIINMSLIKLISFTFIGKHYTIYVILRKMVMQQDILM